MNVGENALRVLEARYLRRDGEGTLCETPDQLFARVARAVAHAELLLGNREQAALWEERFSTLLSSLDFLPNSPTLMNAGTPLGQLSACFVLPIEDSMESIFTTLADMALIQRSGGGTGFSFGRLRPAGDPIASTGGTTPGPLSFVTIYDCATEHIKLGGKRRGANMGALPVDHPDILAFIEAKQTAGSLTNFNLSVRITDAFMSAVERDEPYDLRHPTTGKVAGRLRARDVFQRIAQAARMASQRAEQLSNFIHAAISLYGQVLTISRRVAQPLLATETPYSIKSMWPTAWLSVLMINRTPCQWLAVPARRVSRVAVARH